MSDFYKGKCILVTGGTGSIGGKIVRRLLEAAPAVVRVFSRDETRQYEMQQELGRRADMRYLIGDVRDEQRLKRAMEGIDVVFHAAALKHVPSCEYNPFEAVRTNVQGTQNVVNAALDAGVAKVVAISTDKAVNPVNVMGATKLLAEKLIVTANNWTQAARFASVRFGNVLGTRGSVVPTWIKQIEQGGPVTLTHPQNSRFMMSVTDAIELCLKAGELCEGGEIFILKMPALVMSDLIEVLIQECAPRFGHEPDNIIRKSIPQRPGEKMKERLLDDDECNRAQELEEMLVVRPYRGQPWKHPPEKPLPESLYDSAAAPKLDRDAIRDMLHRANLS